MLPFTLVPADNFDLYLWGEKNTKTLLNFCKKIKELGLYKPSF